MKTLVVATRNVYKFNEISELLQDLDYNLMYLNDFESIMDIEENGSSFQDNAIKKAEEVYGSLKIMTLADDSGIEVDALNGAPGIYSARYAGDNATDEKNNALLLKNLENVDDEKRTAQYVCVLALADENEMKTFSAVCKGKIIREMKGTNGFGYDPMFIPVGYDKTFGELDPSVKMQISHRALALMQLREYLMSLD
jgi:XTP/dITP diphosphohydrolase